LTPAAGTHVTLALGAMAHGGEAMGRAEDGRMVFALGALPGETASLRLTEVQPRFARAVLAELPAASPVFPGPPRCASFGPWPERGARPGVSAAAALAARRLRRPVRFKTEILRDALRQIGGIGDPPVARPSAWRTRHCRNQIRVHTGPGSAGFVALDHATIVPIPLCHVAHPLVQDLLDSLTRPAAAGRISLRALSTPRYDDRHPGRGDLLETIIPRSTPRSSSPGPTGHRGHAGRPLPGRWIAGRAL
jgi:tRNA/tmRNA/rRNA uracil-C5-methylase (TrmA/RlmC/RlmD family)